MNEDQFREAVSQHLLKEVYEKIREEVEAARFIHAEKFHEICGLIGGTYLNQRFIQF